MKFIDIVKRSGRSLKQAKARTLLTSCAIAVGAFALTMTLGASNGAQLFVNKIISENFDPAELIVTNDKAVFGRADTSKPKEYDQSIGKVGDAGLSIKRITAEDAAKIRNIEGVEQVREGVTVDLAYMTGPNNTKYIGTLQAFSPSQNPGMVAGRVPKPFGKNQVLMPVGLISYLGYASPEDAIGKTVSYFVRDNSSLDINSLLASGNLQEAYSNYQKQDKQSLKETTFTIAGVMKKPTASQPGSELYMFISTDDAKTLDDISKKNTPDYQKYIFAYARVIDGKDKQKLISVQNKIKSAGYEAQSVEDTQKFLTQIITVLQGIVAAFGLIAIVASVFGVINTMYISVLQRTREIGLMKALGMRRRDIGRLFKVEAAWIGFLGGSIGSIFAVILGYSLNPWISRKLSLGDQELLVFKPSQIVILVVLLMLVAIIAGLLPSRKAAKLDPIEALRTE